MIELIPYDASFEAIILGYIAAFFGFHQALVSAKASTPDDDSRLTLAEWQVYPSALFVIVSGNDPAGFIRISYRGPSVAWIEDVYVDPAYRGRGIASSAIACAEDIIRSTPGYTAVCMDVAPRNERALRLYRNLGYVDLSLITVRKEFGERKRDKPVRFLGMDFNY